MRWNDDKVERAVALANDGKIGGVCALGHRRWVVDRNLGAIIRTQVGEQGIAFDLSYGWTLLILSCATCGEVRTYQAGTLGLLD